MDINLFVFATGIGFVIIYYSYLTDLIHHIWAVFVAYIGMSIFLFFYPLIGARESMKRNKEQFLKRFSKPLEQEYEVIFQEFKDGVDKSDKHLSTKHLARVTALRDIYDRAMTMPVWPFDRDTVLAFTSRVLLPIILIVINIVISE